MEVREAMTELALAVGPGHTLRQAAKMMADRRVGAAVVIDPDPHPLQRAGEDELFHRPACQVV